MTAADRPAEPASATAPPPLRLARGAATGLTAGLVLLGLGWELAWAPTGRGLLALKVLPLAAALPGLWRHRLYTYRWLSLLLWLYVMEGLVRGTSDRGPSRVLAWAETGLALALFAVCSFYIRRRLAGASRPPSELR